MTENPPPERLDWNTEDLLLRAGRGDESAWELLLAHLWPYPLRLFHGRVPADLRRRFETFDFVQEGVVQAYKSADRFEPMGPGSARAWLKKVIARKLQDVARHHLAERRNARRDCARIGVDPFGEPPAADLDPAEITAQTEELAQTLISLGRLDPTEREIVTRHHFEGQPLSAIARDLGIAETTLRRMYAGVLNKLAPTVQR